MVLSRVPEPGLLWREGVVRCGVKVAHNRAAVPRGAFPFVIFPSPRSFGRLSLSASFRERMVEGGGWRRMKAPPLLLRNPALEQTREGR